MIYKPQELRLTIFIPCHNPKLSAYMPARAFSRSTRRIVDSGIVNRTDFRSTEEKVRYGGRIYSFPAYKDFVSSVIQSDA